MDARRVSAALGFALLIGCVIGIVILIHNSGTSRRSSFSPFNAGISDGAKDRHHHHHFVNGKRENGFVNDPNYRSSQPTMAEMNELADELHRFLSPKSKPALDSIVNGTINKASLKKKNNGSLLMLDHHKSFPHPPATSSAAGSKKASISVVNYSHIPINNNPPHHHGSENVPSNYQHPATHNLDPHQSLRPQPATAGGKLNVVEIGEQGGFGRERGGLPSDFYKTPWLQSMVAPPSPGVLLQSSAHSNVTSPIQQRQPNPLPNYPRQHNHYHINDRRPLRPSHINGNHRTNIPFLPPIPINGTRHPQRNRFGHPSNSPPARQPEMTESGFDDLSEEEDNPDFVETTANEHGPFDNVADDDDDDEGDDVEWEEEEEADDPDPKNKTGDLEPKDFIADFQSLFQLANHLYTSPRNNSGGSVLQGFLKVINETIERGNNMRILAELNEIYGGRLKKDENGTHPPVSTNAKTDILKDRQHNKTMTPNETSLTAFIFMSFGVFLLNQIHSFVQKSAMSQNAPKRNTTEDGTPALGRALLGQDFFDWFVEPLSVTERSGGSLFLGREPSSLDILFEEPKDSNLIQNDTFSMPQKGESRGRSVSDNNDNSFSSSQHVNNMFRALLNIVNAYTKNSEVMECIWSLYCQDLDHTAGKRGLYGVAARINSVGLRLIMDQIPPSLTLDVILRSLVGWDGLPCRKMFPACAATNGTISLVDDAEMKRTK